MAGSLTPSTPRYDSPTSSGQCAAPSPLVPFVAGLSGVGVLFAGLLFYVRSEGRLGAPGADTR